MTRNFDSFLSRSIAKIGRIHNEQSLQVELGILLRGAGHHVEFEKKFDVERINTSYPRPKSRLDLYFDDGAFRTAIELKVPRNSRHPETFFDFCKDIEFVEAILKAGKADKGYCIFITDDPVFWSDSGRGSPIHNIFRIPDSTLHGMIEKPTGNVKEHISLAGTYTPANEWRAFPNPTALKSAKFLMIEVLP